MSIIVPPYSQTFACPYDRHVIEYEAYLETCADWCFENQIYLYPIPAVRPGFFVLQKWVCGVCTVGTMQYKAQELHTVVLKLYGQLYQRNHPSHERASA